MDDDRWLGPARLAFFTPVREAPPLADRKACVLLAANSLMATVLLGFSHRIGELVLDGSPWLAWTTRAVLGALILLGLVGGWHAFAALTVPVPALPPSLAFYRDIAALPADDYRRQVRALDHRQALRAMLDYNYGWAALSIAKFRRVERSVACVRYTFELWVALLVLLTLGGA